MSRARTATLSAAAALAVVALAGGAAWWLSSPAPEPSATVELAAGAPPARSAESVDHGPRDAAWPPVHTYPRADDPSDDSIVIPASWSAEDQLHAQEWLAAQRFTNDCLASRGGTYFYRAFWLFPGPSSQGEVFDENGEQRLNEAGDPVPPPDWATHMTQPSALRSQTSLVCWNQALVSVGRPPLGPTEFQPVAPRFEATDFSDPATLDIPADWDADRQQRARDEWAVELGVRDCMAAAGYPTYGDSPRWLVPEDRAPRVTDWLMSFPVAEQASIRTLLNGGLDHDAWYDSCAGQVSTALGIDLH
ncbi:hypothetical protein DVJ78_05940 [Humibacter sp. BT305]|nr:hypothetical protein DVJ78_05940 [Humibacter sp. BT305]